MALCSAICLLGFSGLIGFVRLFPVAMLTDYETIRTTADPASIAGQINLALRTMGLAAPLLALSGILLLIASLLASGRKRAGL